MFSIASTIASTTPYYTPEVNYTCSYLKTYLIKISGIGLENSPSSP
jgi:hypothetical protein